jgi:hypothetical protein
LRDKKLVPAREPLFLRKLREVPIGRDGFSVLSLP